MTDNQNIDNQLDMLIQNPNKEQTELYFLAVSKIEEYKQQLDCINTASIVLYNKNFFPDNPTKKKIYKKLLKDYQSFLDKTKYEPKIFNPDDQLLILIKDPTDKQKNIYFMAVSKIEEYHDQIEHIGFAANALNDAKIFPEKTEKEIKAEFELEYQDFFRKLHVHEKTYQAFDDSDEPSVTDDEEILLSVDKLIDDMKLDQHNKEKKKELFIKLSQLDDISREVKFSEMKKTWNISVVAIKRAYEQFTRVRWRTTFTTDDGYLFKNPPGYQMTGAGIIANQKQQITHKPYYIKRMGRNNQSGVEYVELWWGTNNHRIVEKMTIALTKSLIEESNYGAPVNSANAIDLVKFFDSWIAHNVSEFESFEVVNQLGWFGPDQYILTDRILGKNKFDNVTYVGDISIASYSKKGKLKDWIATVKLMKSLRRGQVARFVVYAGFASAVLKPLNVRPFIIHLHSDTSKGKTTILRFPASIYGDPVEGKAIIKWHNTENYIIRYMEALRNVPLVIDGLETERSKKTFDNIIYMMESGLSKGKASKNDPNSVVKQRTFRLGVFSSGEMPILSEKSMGGAVVRTWEFSGSPVGVDDKSLVHKIERGLYENYGVAIEPFIENFLKIRDVYAKGVSFYEPKKGEKLSNVEERMLQLLDIVYTTGEIVNQLFKFGFNVEKDMNHIFKRLRKPIGEKVRTVEKIEDRIRDYVATHPTCFPEVETHATEGQRAKKIDGRTVSRIYGYIFENDLGFIKSHFMEWMNEVRDGPNGGQYAIDRLRERSIIELARVRKRIGGNQVDLLYFKDFFKEIKEVGGDDDDPF